MNKAMILGRIGTDLELKTIGSGQNVVNFSVATNKRWTNKDGEKQERTEWHSIVFWGKQADVIAKYFNKGDLILVEGEIQTRSWEGDDGVKRYKTEINGNSFYFANSNKTEAGQSDAAPAAARVKTSELENFAPGADEIPF